MAAGLVAVVAVSLAAAGFVLAHGAALAEPLTSLADLAPRALALGADRTCPARLAPQPGVVRLTLVPEDAAQAAALDPAALARYLQDRMGRAFDVRVAASGDEAAYRAAVAQAHGELLVFLPHGALGVLQTNEGPVNAAGYAMPGTPCARVSFYPSVAVTCEVGGQPVAVEPVFPRIAHEVGHLLGLGHTAQGIMGKGAYRPCTADTFDAAQRAAMRAWGV
ncbi:MAG TPA: hypothetical protein VGR28_02235 [Candidatus Thermoplasmatota archaeon]|nr:hypothetical protein [Candidatus Thermoplasmatota archaeon]